MVYPISRQYFEPSPPPSLWLRYLGAPTLSFHDLVVNATAKVTESGAIADTTRRMGAPFESGAIPADPFGRRRLGRRPLPSQQDIRSIGPLHAEMLAYRISRKQWRTNQGAAEIEIGRNAEIGQAITRDARLRHICPAHTTTPSLA